MRLFLPKRHVKSIFEIEPAHLISEGKKGIVVDLDNTLVPWNVAHATDEVIEWIEKMQRADLKVTIFSNNNKERVSAFADPIGVPYIYKARKPLGRSFKKAARQMGIKQSELAVIGDQLLTDILGGNMSGAYPILVVPIVQSDAPITKFNRRIERIILNYFYRRGKLTRSVTDGK